MIVFEVPGQPVPQPRHRVAARGRFAHAYIPAAHPIHAYRGTIEAAARGLPRNPAAGPVRVELEFVIGRPPSHYKRSGGLAGTAPAFPRKADFDNLAKGCVDAITDAGTLWIDDDQIVDGRSLKRYAAAGEQPRTIVRVWSLDP